MTYCKTLTAVTVNKGDSGKVKLNWIKFFFFPIPFLFLKLSIGFIKDGCFEVSCDFATRYYWTVRANNTIPRGDDICCKRNGEDWPSHTIVNWWCNNIQVRFHAKSI